MRTENDDSLVDDAIETEPYDLKHEVFELMNGSLINANDYFEKLRRGYGSAQQLKSQIIDHSKKGIKALGEDNDIAEAESRYILARQSFEELEQTFIPSDLLWQLMNDSGQELVELLVVLKFYPVLMDTRRVKSVQMPTLEELSTSGITPQMILAGNADAISELGKMITDIAYRECFSTKEDVIALWEHWIEIAVGLRKMLGQFATVYKIAIDASRRVSFRNGKRESEGFHSKLKWIDKLIAMNKRNVVEMRTGLHI